ncbi:hypothetical protein MARSALSMR5_00241 [Marinobacter salarius]|jgi:hypothetical protein|uniref:Uncharacterized protein n=1 Tax=Marinobacter salarius TaxID=1420917 RepID=A0A1W6K4I9_9GAMM|nr:hypothetical protein MARSALSMR5_00241 [Marinobacter salarius]
MLSLGTLCYLLNIWELSLEQYNIGVYLRI